MTNYIIKSIAGFSAIAILVTSSVLAKTTLESRSLRRDLSPVNEKRKNVQDDIRAFRDRLGIKPNLDLDLQMISKSDTIRYNQKEYSIASDMNRVNLLADGTIYMLDGVPKAELPIVDVFVKEEGNESILVLKEKDGSIRNIVIVDKENGDSAEISAIFPGLFATIEAGVFDKKELGSRFRFREVLCENDIIPNLRRQQRNGKCSEFKIMQLAIAYDSSFCDHVGGENNAFNEIVHVLSVVSAKFQQHGVCIKVMISYLEGYCNQRDNPYGQFITMNNFVCERENLVLQQIASYWSTNKNDVARDSTQLFVGTSLQCLHEKCTIGCSHNYVSLGKDESYGISHVTFSQSISLRASLVSRSIASYSVNSCTNSKYRDSMDEHIDHATNGFGDESINIFLNHLSENSRLLSCNADSCCINHSECDDGNVCTLDSCQNSTCVHFQNDTECCMIDTDCDDGNVCTLDSCQNSTCVHVQNDTECCMINPNGTECCMIDADCDDGNVCTLDSCQNSTCAHFQNDTECCMIDADCDDGNVCTLDSCQNSTCTHFQNNTECCMIDADCDNGLWCDGIERCINNTCEPFFHNPPMCDDGNHCTNDFWVCNETFTGCIFLPMQECCVDDADCDDGIFCNGQEFCSNHRCENGPEPICDDNNVCTDDICTKFGDTCFFQLIASCCRDHADCDNGDWCDGQEKCINNRCQPGNPPMCQDNDPCTINSWVCTSNEMKCESTFIDGCCKTNEDCQNDNFCDGEEFCFKNKCFSGEPPSCFENDICIKGYCDKNVDRCVIEEKLCDDNFQDVGFSCKFALTQVENWVLSLYDFLIQVVNFITK